MDTKTQLYSRPTGDHGSRGEYATVLPATPPNLPVPPPPPPPSQTAPHPAPVAEESEAKMRERLIERAKRLREAVSDSRAVPALSDKEKTLQVGAMYFTRLGLTYM